VAIPQTEEAITRTVSSNATTHLMWARAQDTPWKELCYQFGISQLAAHRRWKYSLSVIV
jgi:hypothetical protein